MPPHDDLNGRIFIGRDLNLQLQFTGAELSALLDQLVPLLRERDVIVRDGVIQATTGQMALAPAQADALAQFLAALPAGNHQEREQYYLTRLIVDRTYRQWHDRYVTLAGGYQPPPDVIQRFSKIVVRSDGPQRELERVRLDDIRDALAQHATFVLLALPGGGKTTVLQSLALAQALQRLHDPDAGRAPLFVRLASQKPDEDPFDFLTRQWQQQMAVTPADAAASLAQLRNQGRLCLLCDALNEMRTARYAERMEEWRRFAAELPAGNRLVFSCRSQDYDGRLQVQQVEIDPLRNDQVAEFARRYLGHDLGDLLWAELQGRHAALLPLARTPIYLRIMVEVFQRDGNLPAHRAQLFERFVADLLRREEAEVAHADWLPADAQYLALSELAYAMQELGVGTEASTAWAANALPTSVTLPDDGAVATPAATVLHLGWSASLLRYSGADDAPEVGFTHHLLQEYFAAEELLRRHRRGEDQTPRWRVACRAREMPPAERGEWDPLPGPPTSGWEQTTLLAAGLYPALIDLLLPINPALAAQALIERRAAHSTDTGAAPDPLLAPVQQALLRRLGDPAIHLRSRSEAGLLLGRLGDPRFPVETVGGVRLILPPMQEIPGGKATIGSGWWDRLAEQRERPRHDVTLAPYAIGCYPVTNAEFACFMAASGYEDPSLWPAGGQYWLCGETPPGEEDPVENWMNFWRRLRANPGEIEQRLKRQTMTLREAEFWRDAVTWAEEDALEMFREWYPSGELQRAPRYWDDERFNSSSQPVVGVTWYEAVAYAAWLDRLTGAGYRLSSEAEWEWAARRGRRTYPWGNGWDGGRLNSLEGRVMATTPVGAYPHGATPDGIYDLAGNAWEWTASRSAGYPYQTGAGLENLDEPGIRIARGGGWAANRKMVRCGFWNWLDPRNWLNSLGYRLARTLSP